MKLMRHFTLSVITLVLMITAMALVAGAESKYGGTITYALEDTPAVSDPHRYGGAASRGFLNPIYSTLFQYTSEGKVVNDVAASIEVVDPATFKVQIRKDVVFHNGTPLRASDIVFSINRIKDPSTGAQLRSQLSILDKVEAIDDYTLMFHFNSPVPPSWFEEIMAQSESAILSEKWMAEGHKFENQHMGSGPFKFAGTKYGTQYILERNPNYYKTDSEGNGLPYVDKLIFALYTDVALRAAAFERGDIDLDLFVPWENLDQFMAMPNLVIDLPTDAVMDITFNVAAPPFDNKLVRQAVAYAIDREKVAEFGFEGYATPVYGSMLGYMPWSWAYNPNGKDRYEYNPQKAKELLTKAGYPNGFTAEILTSATDRMHVLTSQVIAAELEAIGCKVTLRLEDWSKRVASGNGEDYTFSINGTGAKMVDPDFLGMYFHGSIGGYYHRPANWNFPEMDVLLDEARTTLDQEKRRELYWQWEELFLDEAPEVFLVFRQMGAARQKRVQGFEFFPGGLNTASSDGLESAWLDPKNK